MVAGELAGFATKEDLRLELSKKADKADIDRMESRVITALGLVERDADMWLSDLESRVGRLERVTAQ